MKAEDDPADEEPGWAAPAAVAVLGWGAVPLLFASPLSFVLSMCLVAAAGVMALVVLTEPVGRTSRRGVAAFGVLGAVTAVCLVVLPFLFQD